MRSLNAETAQRIVHVGLLRTETVQCAVLVIMTATQSNCIYAIPGANGALPLKIAQSLGGQCEAISSQFLGGRQGLRSQKYAVQAEQGKVWANVARPTDERLKNDKG